MYRSSDLAYTAADWLGIEDVGRIMAGPRLCDRAA
jgi:hypothetical protein